MKKLITNAIALTAISIIPLSHGQDPAAPAGEAVKLQLGVTPAVMKFDKAELEVKAGAKVALTFTNAACPLQHNFLLLKPGTKDKVGAEADKGLTDLPAFMKLHCIPASTDILAKSNKLVGPAQSDEITFTAPTEPGDYPYICTFPGHWRLMQGVLKVK